MKLKEFYNRLENRGFFKIFKKENNDIFLISTFCFLSRNEKEGDKISFNFYSPSKKKFFCSEYPFYEIKELEKKEIKEESVSLDNLKVDIEDLWQKAEEVSEEKKPQKLICFLTKDGWKLRIFYNDLSLKKVDINNEGKIEKVENNNLKDFFSLKRN